MRYLGIDYGAKRVGVALSDEAGRVAFPHAVLQNSRTLMTELQKICDEKQVVDIVLGESRDLSGAPNKIARQIDVFKKEIGGATQLPVHYEPEFWSSAQAERWQGKTDKLDASAAAIILQSFLDRKNQDINNT